VRDEEARIRDVAFISQKYTLLLLVSSAAFLIIMGRSFLTVWMGDKFSDAAVKDEMVLILVILSVGHGLRLSQHSNYIVLAHISHQLSAAASDEQHPTGFSHLRVLDVLSSTTPRPSNRKPSWSQHLSDLATKPGEIGGLVGRGLHRFFGVITIVGAIASVALAVFSVAVLEMGLVGVALSCAIPLGVASAVALPACFNRAMKVTYREVLADSCCPHPRGAWVRLPCSSSGIGFSRPKVDFRSPLSSSLPHS